MNDFVDFEISQQDLEEIDNIEVNLLNDSFQIHSEDDDPIVSKRRRRVMVFDSEESEPEDLVGIVNITDNAQRNTWTEPKGKQHRVIAFTENPGLPIHLRSAAKSYSPYDFFSLMVDDAIFQLIVDDTNEFAINKIAAKEASKEARIRNWSTTDIFEMKSFFALILFMGLVKLPKLSDYWSRDEIIGHPFPRTIMSRNRFELLLQMVHFSQQDEANKSNRLHRVSKLIDKLNENFKKHYIPGEDLCIDESVVPFRGRLIFRQYNKQKRHKYGIKIFKLCTLPGYTYKLSIYAGKENDKTNSTPANVVMCLCSDLFDKGHTLYTDNWYTSVDLARQLLNKETHLVGTIRKNRKHLPKNIITAKLKRGEHIAMESLDGITFLKWKDKRDVYVLSTKHTDKFRRVMSTKSRKMSFKPEIVLDYNKAKGAVDLSDQMTAYCTPLRKSVKWYKKLAISLLLNTALVNALVLYQMTGRRMQIVEFRKQILLGLIREKQKTVGDSRPKRVKHKLEKKDGPSKKCRRSCVNCYKVNAKTMGRKQAKNKTKKVVTFCATCPEKPFLCLDCFYEIHKS